MPLSDEYPRATTQVIEMLLYGKTLEEQNEEIIAKVSLEKDTKSILGFLAIGIAPEKIAQGLSLDLKFVEEIIAKYAKKKLK